MCSSCKASYSGFGEKCSSCRKFGCAPQQCSGCGTFGSFFGDQCTDCTGKATTAGLSAGS